MKFEQGTTVKTADGDTVGKIERIVIDPSNHQVTHVVIEKGFLFTSDHVIPIEVLIRADDNAVVLSDAVEDINQFPKFEQTHYVTSNDNHLPPQWGGWAGAPLVYYPPVNSDEQVYYPGIGYATAEKEKHTSRNIPADTIAIGESTKVVTSEGDHAGHVEKTFTNSNGNVTHILISKGLIFNTERLIPIQWVSQMSDSEVTLRVAKNVLENLPEYVRQ